MDSILILLDDLDDWKPYYETSSVLTVSNFLKQRQYAKGSGLVINLSNNYGYNSEGYYCSLLAQARGYKVIPGVEIINSLETGTGIRMEKSLLKICHHWIQKNNIKEETWYMNIYFGTCKEEGLTKVARFIFDTYPCPLLKVGFNTKLCNQIETIQALPLTMLSSEEQDYFANALDKFSQKVWRSPRSPKSSRYSLAIFHDPLEKIPPSNKKALNKFLDLSKRMNINAELITEEDSTRLLEFDALFIRATTAINHITFHLSQTATRNNMVVIDDPLSIIRCTNKVYLNELLEKENIPAPPSMLVFKTGSYTFEGISHHLGEPFILKIPDGSYSYGIIKITNETELADALSVLFEKSAILLAQKFIPTEYDWRIGILDGDAIFACKYYMAKGHWQIYNHSVTEEDDASGLVDTIPIYKVPQNVLRTALKATSCIGKGLYGVDLKVENDKAIIIEINDNPSIDHGIEDAILGDELYFRILNHFIRCMEMKHK